VGWGSTFQVTTRFELRQEPQVEEVQLPRFPRTLIVDDNATNRKILERMLAGWEIRAESVDSGHAALKSLSAAQAAGKPYELLLVDVCMPYMDGPTLIENIREQSQYFEPSILVLSSADSVETAQVSRSLRVTRHLSKPVSIHDLKNALFDQVHVPATTRQSAPRSGPTPGPDSAPLGLRILVAEDNLVNQRVVSIMLTRMGDSVTVARDGEDALAITNEQDFDLVFMDIQMPKLDGFETTAALRNTTRWARIPIVAMTANAMKGDRERCIAAGMDDYVSKPIRIEEMTRVIQQVVARSLAPA
jgi:CheY-like chemotaxis protein